MAPGVNGTGKYTGTVPKSKTHNDGRRDPENRRDASINNISNNLVPFDWQQIPDSSQNLSLKHSNTRTCDSDCYEFDGSSSHELDNRRRRLLSEEQGIHNSYLPAGYPPASIKPSPHPRQLRHNAHRISCFPQQSVHSPQLNHSHIQPRLAMASDEEEGASSYDSYQFSQMGERNGGAQGWMDPGGSGEGRASRNHISPSTSEQQVKGSKGRDERDRNILPDRENKSNISKMPDRNQVLSRLNQIRDYINQTTSLMDRMQTSRDPRVTAEYCKLTKMLQGLRDSEKKLEDLLSTLKNLAECEAADLSGNSMLENVDYDHLQRFTQRFEVLKKQEDMHLHLCSRNLAKMKQEMPDGRSSGRNLSREKELNPQVGAVAKVADPGNRNDLKTKIQKQEIELISQNDMVNSLPDFSRGDLSPTSSKSKLDDLKERIQALKDLYENRNQLMELLGDEDEELSSEHQVLQNKIEDLQQKKNQMDQLVQELRSLNCFIPDEDGIQEAANGPQVPSIDMAQQMAVGDAENEMPERDIQEVLRNMEELKLMKERLAILQGMITTANHNQAAGGDPIGNDSEEKDHTVSQSRHKQQRRKQQSCSKPDNISLSSEAGSISDSRARQLLISSRELERKTLKLQEAKQRLQQLESLLDVVQENRSEGQGLSSEQYAQLMHAVKDGVSEQQMDECEETGQLNSASEGQALLANKQQRNYGSENSGPTHGNKRQAFSRSRTSSMHGSEDVDARLRSSSPIPSSTELSVEALQAMTQNLKEQAMSIRAERERLAAVKWQIGQRQRGEPPPSPPLSSSASSSSESSSSQRDKNRNTMEMDTQSCRQLLLQAELQAKRRELEELMRKDLGHQAAINQDMSSEMSASKSETTAFNHINAEGTTTNATWGGSTQGTLDDLAEREIEIQDQNADYSSDDGRNEEEAKDGAHFRQPAATQDHKITQLNVSLAREQPNERSQSAHRDMLNISLDSQGRRKGSVNSNNAGSNASSTLGNRHSNMQTVNRSSPGRSPVRMTQGQTLPQNSQHSTPSRSHLPSSHNVWKKESIDNSGPRAIWTPSSAHGRQENICPADELAAESVSGSNAATAGSSIHPSVSSVNPPTQPNATSSNQNTSSWWQQQAQQLQNQLEATTSLCQSLMSEQQHHGSASSCPFPGMTPGYGMAHPHPLGVATPPTASQWPFTNLSAPWMLAPSPLFPAPDHPQTPLAIHSCASHQMQNQQQVLLTLSQCCQLLWLQHRELATLQATVQGIQDRLGREPRQEEEELRNIQLQQSQMQQSQMQQSQMQQPLSHSLLYHNRVSTANNQPAYSVPMAQGSSSHSLPRRTQKPVPMQSPYPEVVREGLVTGDVSSVHGAGATAASGVASAHSLPNLCASGTAIMGLPHLISQSADAHPSPTAAYPFPSESLHPPPPPLGASTYAHGDHWALHPSAAGVARGPPVALNNQVPPGIRANNYWDNFRSYSRQNLLSTTSKSNEGFPHIPSPLVMRSHNFLRSGSHGPSLPTTGLNASPVTMPPAARHIMQCQKEKLNTQQQSGVSQQPNMSRTIPNPAGSDGSQYGAVGFTSQDLPWDPPQPQLSQVKVEQPSLHEDSNRRHTTREGSGLFQMLRESVYSEVATLIAQNENRPHYLIQLFRDLQMVSCDALRQRTLLSIHRLVSRYIQENEKDARSGLPSASVMDSEAMLPNPRECDSSGEDEIQVEERSYHAAEGDNFSSPSLHPIEMELKHTVDKAENQQLSHEAMGPSIDSCQDSQETMNENIQSMLHQLLPLLKPHLDEPSSFMLLQNICLLAFQFLSSNINADGNKSKDSPLNTSLSFHQLNSLLEETCLRFEGCKLKDVGEELLISIGEVLVKAITSSNQETNERKMDEDIEEAEEEILEPQAVIQERTEEVAEEDRNTEIDESNQVACYDEDLAEADQSLDSGEIIISDVRGPQKRFSISKETKGEVKETEAGTSSFSCDDAFVIIVGTEGEAVGKRIAADSVDEMVIHGSEDFVECNGNDNDNTCCNADELGAEALIEHGECSFSRVENEPVEKTEVAGWDDQKPVKEHGADEASSTSSPSQKPCSSTPLPKVPTSKIAQEQWAGSDDDTDVVIGDEAGMIESTKGDTSGSI